MGSLQGGSVAIEPMEPMELTLASARLQCVRCVECVDAGPSAGLDDIANAS
jgi:hypothetical protein